MSTPTKPSDAPATAGAKPDEVSARERLGYLGRNTKLWLGALVLLLLAVVIVAASGAVPVRSSTGPTSSPARRGRGPSRSRTPSTRRSSR